MEEDDMCEIAEQFSKISLKYNIEIETCSEGIDLLKYGVKKGKCIDDRLVSKIINADINVNKDDTQREVCGCVKSIDIGQYNTCMHHCLYCYANFNKNLVEDNYSKHNKKSPILVGELRGDEKITVREMKSIKSKRNIIEQISLF